MIAIGDRVFASNPQVSGKGTVFYIAHYTEILPVQVELDEADADGHRMYRFKYTEVEAIL